MTTPTVNSEPTVEEALRELREMFPDRYVSVCATWGLVGNQVSVSIRNPASNDTSWGSRYEASSTLSTAMENMRKWKESQSS